MTTTNLKKSAYRLRGYECPVCHDIQMVFGSGGDPLTCDCGQGTGTAVPVKKWDHWNVESIETSDYANQDVLPVVPPSGGA